LQAQPYVAMLFISDKNGLRAIQNFSEYS